MRVTACTSSPLISPTSGFSTTPVKWPSRGEPLGAGDQRVLVGAVQRVARLEGERALPLAVADQRARLARREHVLAVLRVLRLRQRAQRAAERAACAGPSSTMRPPGWSKRVGAVDASRRSAPCPRSKTSTSSTIATISPASSRSAAEPPARERARLVVGHREARAGCPRRSACRRPRSPPRRARGARRPRAHRALERRERAVGDAVDGREVGARDAQRRQLRRLGAGSACAP